VAATMRATVLRIPGGGEVARLPAWLATCHVMQLLPLLARIKLQGSKIAPTSPTLTDGGSQHGWLLHRYFPLPPSM
jgi:hypothetical protein